MMMNRDDYYGCKVMMVMIMTMIAENIDIVNMVEIENMMAMDLVAKIWKAIWKMDTTEVHGYYGKSYINMMN